ncbi:MAG: lamin tail domain-containing protein [Verrucomicrobiota bacterium]|nr:lamin tail domain-containing protein [Verrucomicrobiota bacterium]
MKPLSTIAILVQVFAVIFLPCSLLSAELHITEFMADNKESVEDVDGDASDWIEISNVNRENGSLEGYHLTDDPLNLTKWTFPKKSFNDEGFILVFASGKDLTDPNNDLHTNFKLSSSENGYLALIKPDGITIASEFKNYPRQYEDVSYGSGYGEPKDVKFIEEGDDAKWIVPSAFIDGWQETLFDDSDWFEANTGIGYDNSTKYIPHLGEGGDVKAAMRGVNASIYIRVPFTLNDASGVSDLILRMKWEDGFIAYLNGTKIESLSAPENPVWNSTSSSNRSNENDVITFFDYPVTGPLQKGQNILAIQGLNGSQNSSDFLVSPELTAKKTDLNSPKNGYFLNPTPGTLNGERIDGLVSDTKFNVNRGFYEEAFELEISTKTEGAEIRYTLDGTVPSETRGEVYKAPITINKTTVIRAMAHRSGYSTTNIDTQTYLFPEDVVNQPRMRASVTQSRTFGPQMIDSLKSVPTVSIVTDNPSPFMNEGSGNMRRESPASVEMIFPDGTPGFQENGGLKHFGGYYTNFPKKSFRIGFRSQYGDTKLNYPMFDGFDYKHYPPTDRFDVMDLRSGSHDMQNRGGYMSNRFTDDSMLEMGNLAPHGRFVHVYLNGIYWGQYHLRERWNADMASSYFGGPKADYDAVNLNDGFRNDEKVYDGTGVLWNETKQVARSSNAWELNENHIDFANLIDFMLLWVSGDSESEVRLLGSKAQGQPFRFQMKDADGFLRNPGKAVNHPGPFNLTSSSLIRKNPDYAMLVADRIHMHFFNDGALTPERNIARLQKRVDEARLGFISESARWGNRFREYQNWLDYQKNLTNNHFPRLTENMIKKFRAAGMYPSLISPVFNQHGGSIPVGSGITMSTNTLAIYYTTDGSDPRLSGGAINPQAITATFDDEVPIPKDYVKNGHVWKYLDDGSDQGKLWIAPDFDDSKWSSGPSELGYREGDEATLISYVDSDDRSGMQRNATTYFRTNVELSDPSSYSFFIIKLKYDDGAAVYANGLELIRTNNLPSDAGHDTYATSGTPNERTYHEYQVPSSSFVDGINHLAVEIHNSSPSSSDISFDLILRGEVDVSKGNRITVPIILNDPSMIRARAYDPIKEEWSALNEAFFSIGSVTANAANFIITEFHYHPEDPSSKNELAVSADRDDYEFIEFLNTDSSPIDLSNVHFKKGINFTFPDNTILGAGEYLLLVRDRKAFETRYGVSAVRIYEYKGRLSNDGEQLHVINNESEDILNFTYNDQIPWPKEADGGGPTLVLVGQVLTDPSSWVASRNNGGSPGEAEVETIPYAEWALQNAVQGGPEEDDDGDAVSNYLEYYFGSRPDLATDAPLTNASIQRIGGANYLTLSFPRNLFAQASMEIQLSFDLRTWTAEPEILETVSNFDNGDGTAEVTVRYLRPIDNSSKKVFFRLFSN